METVAVISQKGGSGKTTLAVHMAVCAAIAGLRVALIDLDPQGSMFDWNEARDPERRFDATRATADELPVWLPRCKRALVDLVIIDTAPQLTRAAAAAASAADYVLIPCRPARFDLRAIGSTLQLIRLSRTPYGVALNAVPPRGFRLAAEARERLQAGGARVLAEEVRQYTALTYAVSNGESIHEYAPDSPAADDITRLFNRIAGFLLPTRERVSL